MVRHVADPRENARECPNVPRGRARELAVTYPTQSVDCEESAFPALVWSVNAERRELTARKELT